MHLNTNMHCPHINGWPSAARCHAMPACRRVHSGHPPKGRPYLHPRWRQVRGCHPPAPPPLLSLLPTAARPAHLPRCHRCSCMCRAVHAVQGRAASQVRKPWNLHPDWRPKPISFRPHLREPFVSWRVVPPPPPPQRLHCSVLHPLLERRPKHLPAHPPACVAACLLPTHPAAHPPTHPPTRSYLQQPVLMTLEVVKREAGVRLGH